MRNQNATIMQNKRHLSQDGVAFLRALRKVYRNSLSRGEIRKRLSALNIAKIKPQESIDSFAVRIIAEKTYIKESTKYATIIDDVGMKYIFIHGLSPEFTDIKKNVDNLPPEWNHLDIESLIPVAKAYLQRIHDLRFDNDAFRTKRKAYYDNLKPKSTKPGYKQQPGPSKSTDPTPNRLRLSTDPKDIDRRLRLSVAIQKGTLKFKDYISEIPPNTCLWHGAHHPTHKCKTITYFLAQANLPGNDDMETYQKQCTAVATASLTPVAKRATTSDPPATSSNTIPRRP